MGFTFEVRITWADGLVSYELVDADNYGEAVAGIVESDENIVAATVTYMIDREPQKALAF